MTNATRVQRTRPRIAPVSRTAYGRERMPAPTAQLARLLAEVNTDAPRGARAGPGAGADETAPVEALVGVRHRLAGFGGLAPAEAGGTVDETEGPERASNAPGAPRAEGSRAGCEPRGAGVARDGDATADPEEEVALRAGTAGSCAPASPRRWPRTCRRRGIRARRGRVDRQRPSETATSAREVRTRDRL